MTDTVGTSWYVNIWIAGDERTAVEAMRQYAMKNPTCVTITPTSFVYTAGMETGVCVRLINYPRFPSTHDELAERASDIAEFLMVRLAQRTCCIESPVKTIWKHYEVQTSANEVK